MRVKYKTIKSSLVVTSIEFAFNALFKELMRKIVEISLFMKNCVLFLFCSFQVQVRARLVIISFFASPEIYGKPVWKRKKDNKKETLSSWAPMGIGGTLDFPNTQKKAQLPTQEKNNCQYKKSLCFLYFRLEI